MKKIILILFLVMLLPGCGSTTKQETIEMNCDGTVTSVTVKENDKLSCKLLSTNYEFTIGKISDNEIEISTTNYGLGSTGSLISKEKSWAVKKGEKLTLTTQSTDYQERVIFNW